MSCHITLVFANNERLEFDVADSELARFNHESGSEWLSREFEEAGCVPSNPVGKLLAADKIITLAKSRSQRVFEQATPWVGDFLAASAAVLNRPLITIDLGSRVIGY